MKKKLSQLRKYISKLKGVKIQTVVVWTAILSSISTVVMMILSLISIENSIDQFTESNKNSIKQTELLRQQIEDNKTFAFSQIPPTITIEPKYGVKAKNGDFKIKIINNNLYDLTSLALSTNYYQAGWEKNGLTGFTVNMINSIPNKVLDTLKRGAFYELVIEKEYLEFVKIDPPTKTFHADFLKITVAYDRIIDKKTFITNKVYHHVGDNLFDEEEDTKIKYGSVTFKEIKEYLGVEMD